MVTDGGTDTGNGNTRRPKLTSVKNCNIREPFENVYELLNLRALKFSPVDKIHIFQCMGKIFRMKFQRVPIKFHTKYLTHILKGAIFILR